MRHHRHNQFQLIRRIGRIERKCDRIAADIAAVRELLAPSPGEIDRVIHRIHATASALRRQSERECRLARMLRSEK